MKKISLLFTLAFSVSAMAQQSADVTLRVTLNPIQTIFVDNNANILMEYSEPSHYQKGIKKEADNQLRVFSTNSFVVKAASSNPEFDELKMTIKAEKGSSNPLESIVRNEVMVLESDKKYQNLFTSETGANDLTVKMIYQGKGEGAYIGLFGKAKKDYSTTVTYTIEPI